MRSCHSANTCSVESSSSCSSLPLPGRCSPVTPGQGRSRASTAWKRERRCGRSRSGVTAAHPRAGVWKLQEANRRHGSTIVPGQRLLGAVSPRGVGEGGRNAPMASDRILELLRRRTTPTSTPRSGSSGRRIWKAEDNRDLPVYLDARGGLRLRGHGAQAPDGRGTKEQHASTPSC